MKIFKKIFSFWKLFTSIWLICILVFAVSLAFATNLYSTTIDSTRFGSSIYYLPIFLGSILIGIISFIIAFVSFIFTKIKNKILIITFLAVPVLITCLMVLMGLGALKDTNTNTTPFGNIPSFQKPTLTATTQGIIDLTNEERVKVGLKTVKEDSKLDEAAQVRAQKIIDYNEWSHEEPATGVTYTKAIKQVNYWNVTYGENLARDIQSSDAIVDAWMNSPEHKKNLLDPTFQDIGIAIKTGQMGGVETTIVVQLFGGYQSPNYKQSDIDSWKASADSLRNILPSWEKIKNFPTTYSENKKDADRLLEIINIRITRDQAIYETMKANKWLSSQQNAWVKEDTALYNEEEAISNRLNSLTWH